MAEFELSTLDCTFIANNDRPELRRLTAVSTTQRQRHFIQHRVPTNGLAVCRRRIQNQQSFGVLKPMRRNMGTKSRCQLNGHLRLSDPHADVPLTSSTDIRPIQRLQAVSIDISSEHISAEADTNSAPTLDAERNERFAVRDKIKYFNSLAFGLKSIGKQIANEAAAENESKTTTLEPSSAEQTPSEVEALYATFTTEKDISDEESREGIPEILTDSKKLMPSTSRGCVPKVRQSTKCNYTKIKPFLNPLNTIKPIAIVRPQPRPHALMDMANSVNISLLQRSSRQYRDNNEIINNRAPLMNVNVQNISLFVPMIQRDIYCGRFYNGRAERS